MFDEVNIYLNVSAQAFSVFNRILLNPSASSYTAHLHFFNWSRRNSLNKQITIIFGNCNNSL